jgi:hypothetical protein
MEFRSEKDIQALGHIWVIFQPGRWVTLGRFFDQGARSHKGDFLNMALDHIGAIFRPGS